MLGRFLSTGDFFGAAKRKRIVDKCLQVVLGAMLTSRSSVSMKGERPNRKPANVSHTLAATGVKDTCPEDVSAIEIAVLGHVSVRASARGRSAQSACRNLCVFPLVLAHADNRSWGVVTNGHGNPERLSPPPGPVARVATR